MSSTLNFELLAPKADTEEFRIRVKLNDEYLNLEAKKDQKGDTTYTMA
jgi:hypothetical protein